MSKPKIPEKIRKEMKSLIREGQSDSVISSKVMHKIAKLDISYDEFCLCLSSMKGKVTQEK